jgi:hypothetical protein
MGSLNTYGSLNTGGSLNTFERVHNSDGSPNPKYVDVLEEDKPIAGQKFSCISFISPEKIIKMRELFFFEKFLKQWEFSKSLEAYTHFLHFLAYKYSLTFESLEADLQEFCKDEKEKLCVSSLEDDYKNYIDTHETEIENEYNALNKFQTSVRGVKIRGSYPTQEEAELRCKMLREVDPNHDVYVGPVGMWMPFHPEAYKTGRVEYLEEELNQLMHEKRSNEDFAKSEFDKRVRDTKEKAMEDNKKKALESGNVLTQTINADGQLVSVKDMNTSESKLSQTATLSDIRRELFEGDNIVIDKSSDHGLGKIAELHTVAELHTIAKDE